MVGADQLEELVALSGPKMSQTTMRPTTQETMQGMEPALEPTKEPGMQNEPLDRLLLAEATGTITDTEALLLALAARAETMLEALRPRPRDVIGMAWQLAKKRPE